MPVDHPQSARAAGPIPHFRKLAFVFGAGVTVLALLLATHLFGLAP